MSLNATGDASENAHMTATHYRNEGPGTGPAVTDPAPPARVQSPVAAPGVGPATAPAPSPPAAPPVEHGAPRAGAVGHAPPASGSGTAAQTTLSPQRPAGTSAPSTPAVTDESLPPLVQEPGRKVTVDDLLRYAVDIKASDLHVKVGSPPTVRVSGLLHPIDVPVMTADGCNEMATAMLGEKEAAVLGENGEVDFAYSLPGVSRFRVNIHKQRGTLGIASRRILPGAPNLSDLILPPAVANLASEHRGLLLVTGPTSSGKTTTCGAILKHVNQSRRCHIVTIEDPIEILHQDELAVVTQREVGADTKDFHAALRAAMRQDPDVIFVGEIRDTETVKAALQAAETGHFVLATMHTTDVAETITRVIDFFPPEQQKQVRVALAGSLVGVITQRLLPRVGGGRAPAIEIMIANGRIRDCVLDPEKTQEVHDIVEQSGYYGMQTFDQSLIQLYRMQLVTLHDARSAANNPHDFELKLKQQGLLAV